LLQHNSGLPESHLGKIANFLIASAEFAPWRSLLTLAN